MSSRYAGFRTGLETRLGWACDGSYPEGKSKEKKRGAGYRKDSAARGGLQAWRAVQSCSMRGKMETGGTRANPAHAGGENRLTEPKVQGIKQTQKIEVEEAAINAHVEDSRFAKLQ
jgi:hypothetical protein